MSASSRHRTGVAVACAALAALAAAMPLDAKPKDLLVTPRGVHVPVGSTPCIVHTPKSGDQYPAIILKDQLDPVDLSSTPGGKIWGTLGGAEDDGPPAADHVLYTYGKWAAIDGDKRGVPFAWVDLAKYRLKRSTKPGAVRDWPCLKGWRSGNPRVTAR